MVMYVSEPEAMLSILWCCLNFCKRLVKLLNFPEYQTRLFMVAYKQNECIQDWRVDEKSY